MRDHAGRVHAASITGIDARRDGRDTLAFDQEVAPLQITDARVHRDDRAAADEGACHAC
jgi:hypothetical protein